MLTDCRLIAELEPPTVGPELSTNNRQLRIVMQEADFLHDRIVRVIAGRERSGSLFFYRRTFPTLPIPTRYLTLENPSLIFNRGLDPHRP